MRDLNFKGIPSDLMHQHPLTLDRFNNSRALKNEERAGRGCSLWLPALVALFSPMAVKANEKAETMDIYFSDFENPNWNIGSVDGQGGWKVDQGVAEIIVGEGIDGTAGLVLRPFDPFSQASLSLNSGLFSAGGVTFVELQVRPVASVEASKAEFLDIDSARAALLRENQDVETAALWVFAGDRAGGGEWVRTGINVPVDENSGRTLSWLRLTLREDLGAQSWDLWVDGSLAGASLAFQEPREAGKSVYIFMGDHVQPVALDNLRISATNPLGTDTDRDGMLDDEESVIGSNLFLPDRETEKASGGTYTDAWIKLHEATTMTGYSGQIADVPASAPVFSRSSGLADESFALTLTAPEGCRIVYTLDGSAPRSEHGTEYSGPLEVASTTVVRACSVKGSGETGPEGVGVWIFPAQVTAQRRPEGWPEFFTDRTGSTSVEQNFTMPWTLRFTEDGQGQAQHEAAVEALRNAPAICLSADSEGLFGALEGIYHRPGALEGKQLEGAAVQVLYPDGEQEYVSPAVKASISISGESSRYHDATLKHSLRLRFAAGEALSLDGVPSVAGGSLLLRHPSLDSWAAGGRWSERRRTARYFADHLADAYLMERGHAHLARRFVHVFINGIYQGLYEAVAQNVPAPAGASAAPGGQEAEALLEGGLRAEARAIFGETGAWDSLLAKAHRLSSRALAGEPVTEAEWAEVLGSVDTANLIDYIALNLWLHNEDWPGRNYLITLQSGVFRFLSWDAERVLPPQAPARTVLSLVVEAADGPAGLFAALCACPSFRDETRSRLEESGTADFNDAVFADLINRSRGELRPLLPAEAARWGRWYDPGFDHMTAWEEEGGRIEHQWTPGRTAVVRAEIFSHLAKMSTAASDALARRAIIGNAIQTPTVGPVPFVAEILPEGPQDSDGDGMPDAWEIAHGLNPHDYSDALVDLDGDGIRNIDEFLLGFSPESPDLRSGDTAAAKGALTGVFSRTENAVVAHGRAVDVAEAENQGFTVNPDGTVTFPATSPSQAPVPEQNP